MFTFLVTQGENWYQAFVLPHLGYCSVLWSSRGATLRDKIEWVQNYALHVILKKPPLMSSESLGPMLGWSTLKRRRHEFLFSHIHWCVDNMAPSYLFTKFTSNSSSNYPEHVDTTNSSKPTKNWILSIIIWVSRSSELEQAATKC